MLASIILLAPLAGSIICGFGHRLIGERAAIITATGLLFVAAALSWFVFFTFHEFDQITLFRFIQSGAFASDWSLRIDRLTVAMLVVVTTVSSLVHLYSFGYMRDDPQWKAEEIYRPRFFAYLSFFSFAMLTLVTSDNLLQLFFGWEGVGVASYLLIGFYYRKPSANAAAIKAFIVNRVGDFGMALGVFALFLFAGSIGFDDIFDSVPNWAANQVSFLWFSVSAAELAAVLLFIGACGKSAQIFLHTWLPDAMEGPTPVSALIHAATMVTAGVFLVCRMSPLFEYAPLSLAIVTVIGATTALFAASVGLVQNDIKRVIAYSTCSQLGYMFAAAGVGVYQAAMFHLFTHAFFKALLFLGAGSVITAMHHEQDMRNYGGLRSRLPWTFWTMMIGTLAITGVGIPLTQIGFAGFLSKDSIIESTFAAGSEPGTYAFWLLALSALLTSFYSWRLMFITFFGTARGNAAIHDQAQDSTWEMLVPLVVLAAGSVLAGMVWYNDFFGHHVVEYFGASIFIGDDNQVLHNAHAVPAWVKSSAFVAMLAGLFAAWIFYIRMPSLPSALARAHRPLYLFLLNKWYFDEIYDFLFVRPVKRVGTLLWKKGDGAVIDGVLHAIAMSAVPFMTKLAVRAQSGYVFHYAFVMVVGTVAIIAVIAIGGTGQ